jgi:large subunit ribosomal protein L31e
MEEERVISLRLRKAIEGGPNYERARRAVKYIRKYVSKHFHVEPSQVKISNEVNEQIWLHGGKNPPIKIRIVCVKKDNKVEVKALQNG